MPITKTPIVAALMLIAGLFPGETLCQVARATNDNIKTYPLIGDQSSPEGISIDQRNGRIYTGSLRDGSMQVTINGKAQYFIHADTSIFLPNVLGSSIDERNNRIWVCSNNFSLAFAGTSKARVSVIDLGDEHLIKRFDETDLSVVRGIFAFVNDITLDTSGNAYISNSANTVVFKISADLKEVKVFDKFPEPPTGKKYSLNGIEISHDQKLLLINTFIFNETDVAALFSMNIGTGEVKLIPFHEKETINFSTSGGDGLLPLNENTFLCLTLASTLVKIELDKDWSNASITNISHGTSAQDVLAGCATLAAYNDKLYTSNAQGASVLNPGIKPKLPYKIIEIPKSVVGL